MAGKGPAPTPTALKVLTNSRRINRAEPQAPTGEPTMPADLSAKERKAWGRVVEEMQAVPGLLTRCDRGVLELVARIEPMFRAAAIHVRKHGSTFVAHDQTGAVKFCQTMPEANLVVKLGSQLKSLYAELGLTPAGRSRLSVAPQKPVSKLDAFTRAYRGA